MNEIIIKMPDYAIRYLQDMCRRERAYLSNQEEFRLQDIAAYDSLSAIESSLPDLN